MDFCLRSKQNDKYAGDGMSGGTSQWHLRYEQLAIFRSSIEANELIRLSNRPTIHSVAMLHALNLEEAFFAELVIIFTNSITAKHELSKPEAKIQYIPTWRGTVELTLFSC